MKTEVKTNYAKKEYNIQYQKENYTQITTRVRKDDEILKMLEMYKKIHPSESINSIVVKALRLLLKSVFSYVELNDLKE